MNQTVFGYLPDGTPIYECTLKNTDFEVSVITYGGIIRRFVAYGTDIVCGFDNLSAYLEDTSHQGALIGRYANRIAAGRFTLNGKEYRLDCNAAGGKVHLHGGYTGFSRKPWKLTETGDDHLVLRMISPDGDQGYPGNLTVDVTYTLGKHGLAIEYRAVCDADTPLCLTNHAYLNLGGCGSGSILDTTVVINADEYSLIDDAMIPTGHAPVAGTVFDFTAPHTIGERIGGDFGGYDHNYILRADAPEEIDGHLLTRACTADNGRLAVSVYTNQPCIQFYIGNSLTGKNPFKGGAMPTPHTTMCFEAQAEPNGPNRGESILRAGDVYYQCTVYAVEQL